MDREDQADRRERKALGSPVSSGIEMRQLLVLVPVVAVAVAGVIAGLSGRGADEAFLVDQKNPTRVSAEAVEELMLTAPDPAPPHPRSATRSRCDTDGRRELRNPWRCTVRYRSGSVARFVVTIKSDGSYVGDYVGHTASATGCCLRLPAAE
jgi:hypothetical protein